MNSIDEAQEFSRSAQASRRDLLRQAIYLAGAAPFAGLFNTRAFAQLDTPASESAFAVADTTYGQIRGFNVTPIRVFRGVPYGAPTGGKNRFMPPKPPRSWTGVRNTLTHGDRSPQPIRRHEDQYTQMIDWDRNPGGMSENCLVLDIWTPGLADGRKRPVMVSIHGGGWTQGSGGGSMYDGDALARFGDVVVVSPNHRLGAFGYLNLIDVGAPPEFAYAGVAGVMDLVAMLRWVHDNAEAFGGDPNNVMIYGQSGGGSKTSTLYSIPSARGLLHRAAVQSGSALRLTEREQGAEAASRMIAELGLNRNNIADIQNLPLEQILNAQRRLSEAKPAIGFAPVVDGTVVPRHPFDPTAPEISRDIPMMIGTTLHDAALREKDFNLTEEGLRVYARKEFGERGDQIVQAYRRVDPNSTPFLIKARLMTDRNQRGRAITQAERKAAQGGAPAWLYRFDWPSPAFGGKFGSIHAAEVELTFHNHRGLMAGNTPEAMKMADMIAATWVAFARTGNPNNPRIPHWPAFDLQRRATMIFDNQPRVTNAPDRELVALVAAAPA
jgi:para-nitrobenzyl esterase